MRVDILGSSGLRGRVAEHAAAGERRDGASITLRPFLVVAPLAGLAVVVLLTSLTQDLVSFALPEAGIEHVWRLDVDAEISVPTWLASSVILINAVLLAAIGMPKLATRDRLRWHWLFLAAVFAFLSLDEAAALHEILISVLGDVLDARGFFAYAWVIPALIVCPLGLLAYVPFILDFVERERRFLIASAALFLGGAIGLEMVGAKLAEAHGQQHLAYRLAVHAEEGLESAGMLAFLGALLLYARRRLGRLEIRFG